MSNVLDNWGPLSSCITGHIMVTCDNVLRERELLDECPNDVSRIGVANSPVMECNVLVDLWIDV
jgi:hypothetical protein